MTGEEIEVGRTNVTVLRRKDEPRRGGRQRSKRYPKEARSLVPCEELRDCKTSLSI